MTEDELIICTNVVLSHIEDMEEVRSFLHYLLCYRNLSNGELWLIIFEVAGNLKEHIPDKVEPFLEAVLGFDRTLKQRVLLELSL